MNQLDLLRKSLSPFSEMDSWMGNFLRGDVWPALSPELRRSLAAKCEVSETSSAYQLRFEVPGMRKEDLKVDLHENRLVVSGERREEKKEEREHRVHYSEMSYGSFSRAYVFPTPVDAEKVEAKYEDGILSVTVAKSGSARARQVPVR